MYFLQGDAVKAVETWERLVQTVPERGYLAFGRLESAYPKVGRPDAFPELCRRLIAQDAQDWRARVALARHLSARASAREGIDLLFEAMLINPHGLALHQAIWETLAALDLPRPLVDRYLELTRNAIFYVDPHVCIRCRYRSTELLWLCPHCHEWDTFVEERIATRTAD